jgi:uncharacterized phage protein gp47/JayE
MTIPTLADLTTERTTEQEENALLSVLKSEGFPVSDWEPRGAGETIQKAVGERLAAHGAAVPVVARSGHIEMATGEWLDLAASWYGLTRASATSTVQRCLFRCSPGLGPIKVNTGFTARAASTANLYAYRGEPTVDVPADGSAVEIQLEAEGPGSRYDDPADTIVDIVTPLPGLEIANPHRAFDFVPARTMGPIGHGAVIPAVVTSDFVPPLAREYVVTVTASGDAGTNGAVSISTREGGASLSAVSLSPIPAAYDIGNGVTIRFANGPGPSVSFVAGSFYIFNSRVSPIVRQGADAERDESLASRCSGRWPALGRNITDGHIKTLVAFASIELGLGVSRVVANASNVVAGQTDVTIATSSGSPSAATVLAIQDYITRRVSFVDRVFVRAARNREIATAGTVYVPSALVAQAQASAEAAWRDHLASLPIGGDRSMGYPGVVRSAELIQVVMDAGAIDFSGLLINGTSGNVALAEDEAPVPAGTLAADLTWITT